MARYTGPACKLCRRVGDKLQLKSERCISNKCPMDKRGRAPARRRRMSDRGVQLLEKQRARYTYGLLERQFQRLFKRAEKQAGVTGDNLVSMLERRLDNVAFRLGFGDSRVQARQIVLHGHIMLNGRKTNIPSCQVKEGDTISWRPREKPTEYYKQLTENIKSKIVPSWLSLDKQTMVGKVISMPTPEEVGAKFDGKAIVEYYSR